MTEKPFRSIIDEDDICIVNQATDEYFWIVEKDRPIIDRILDLEIHMNKIIEKKNELQFQYNMEVLNRKRLEKENEQLKSENNRLVKQTAETIAEHQKQVLDLIDEKILECEKAVEEIRLGEKDSYIVKHDVASKILKELKKELTE